MNSIGEGILSDNHGEDSVAFTCPKCSSNIVFGQLCICGYGAKDSLQIVLEKRDRTVIGAYTVTSLVIMLAYIHILNWGPFAFQAPLLKTEHFIGILNGKGYVKLAAVCLARAKEKCAKQAYIDMYNRTKNIEAIAMLAQLEVRLHETEVAVKTFEAYYKKGGKNPDVALQYALALEQVHDYDASVRYLMLSIKQNPDKLSVVATGELLRILIAQQKYAKAQSIIENFWASAENAKGYFNTEAAQIKKFVRPSKGRKLAQNVAVSTII